MWLEQQLVSRLIRFLQTNSDDSEVIIFCSLTGSRFKDGPPSGTKCNSSRDFLDMDTKES